MQWPLVWRRAPFPDAYILASLSLVVARKALIQICRSACSGVLQGRDFIRSPRPRAPLLMLAPRARSPPRSGGPIEFVTMLVPVPQSTPLHEPQPHRDPPGCVPLPPPVVPVALKHDCSGGLGRVTYPQSAPDYPPTCHAAYVYPKTAAADALQAKDQKDGARARARRIEPALRGGLALSPIEQ